MTRRRATFGKRARAAVGWAAGLFVAAQLATGLVIDYRAPLLRFPSAKLALSTARRDPKPPDFAFFGSSRIGAAVYYEELDRELWEPLGPWPRTVSMAVPAGDGISMEFMLDQLLATGPVPKWAVIEVSPETVNAENHWWMPVHVLRQLNWEHVPTHAVAAVKGNAGWPYLESRLVPAYSYRKQLVAEAKADVREWMKPKQVEPDGRPAPRFDPSPVSGLNWADLIRAPAKESNEQLLENSRIGARTTIRKSLRPYRPGGLTGDALERTVARCRATGIPVLLLGVPTCSPHRAEYTPPIEAAYDAFLARLQQEYGCRYVDGRDWVPDTMFLDTLHVDADGGRLFTRRLVREVLRWLPPQKAPWIVNLVPFPV